MTDIQKQMLLVISKIFMLVVYVTSFTGKRLNYVTDKSKSLSHPVICHPESTLSRNWNSCQIGTSDACKTLAVDLKIFDSNTTFDSEVKEIGCKKIKDSKTSSDWKHKLIKF